MTARFPSFVVQVITAIAVMMITGNAHAAGFRCAFVQKDGGVLELTYDAHPKAGTAEMAGNAGSGTVLMLHGDDAVSFVEPTAPGGLTATTISLAAGVPLQAVHSRNTVILGRLRPEQMFGSCH